MNEMAWELMSVAMFMAILPFAVPLALVEFIIAIAYTFLPLRPTTKDFRYDMADE